jgi:hypothetical protein
MPALCQVVRERTGAHHVGDDDTFPLFDIPDLP